MNDITSHSKRAQTQEKRTAQKKIREILAGLQQNRLGFSPAEFAALNNKSATWGYRRIYSGDIKVISTAGRLIIPRTEVDLFFSKAKAYDPKPATRRTA